MAAEVNRVTTEVDSDGGGRQKGRVCGGTRIVAEVEVDLVVEVDSVV